MPPTKRKVTPTPRHSRSKTQKKPRINSPTPKDDIVAINYYSNSTPKTKTIKLKSVFDYEQLKKYQKEYINFAVFSKILIKYYKRNR